MYEKAYSRLIFYFVCILLLGYLDHYALEFINQNMWSFTGHILKWTYPILIGALLGVIILIAKPRVDKFSYDWVLALGLGIPLAYIALHFLLMILFNTTLPYVPSFNYTTSQILLGFVLIAAINGIPKRRTD